MTKTKGKVLVGLALVSSLVIGLVCMWCEQSLAQADRKYVIKFSHNQPIQTPQHEGALEFKKLVEEWSKGRLQVQVYPTQQLGGLREQVEGVQTGAIEISQQPTAILTNFAPQLGIVDTPFLFPNDKVMWQALDSPEILGDIHASLDKVGIKGLHFWANGFKHLTANKPIRSPGDLKGMKYRVMPSPLLVAQFKAFGASAVPIDYAETYNALQQKVVDGVEWPITSIREWKLWEVQKSMSLTGHGYLGYLMIANKKWLESLPPDLRDIIVRAEAESTTKMRRLTIERESADLTEIGKHMEVIRLTDKELSEFQKSAEAAWPTFSEKVGKDFFKKVQDAVGSAKAK